MDESAYALLVILCLWPDQTDDSGSQDPDTTQTEE